MLLKFEELKNKTILVEQVKSEISTNDRQKANLKGLGLHGIGTKSELKCDESIYGMLYKVAHLIDVKVKE